MWILLTNLIKMWYNKLKTIKNKIYIEKMVSGVDDKNINRYRLNKETCQHLKK